MSYAEKIINIHIGKNFARYNADNITFLQNAKVRNTYALWRHADILPPIPSVTKTNTKRSGENNLY